MSLQFVLDTDTCAAWLRGHQIVRAFAEGSHRFTGRVMDALSFCCFHYVRHISTVVCSHYLGRLMCAGCWVACRRSGLIRLLKHSKAQPVPRTTPAFAGVAAFAQASPPHGL